MAELPVLHFRQLRALLSQLPVSVGSLDAGALRLQLEKTKPAFRKLLEKAAPSAREKDEISAGHFTPLASSSRKVINQEFRLEALFLASELGISERLAASILLVVLSDHKPRPGRPSAENAVVLFYEERRDLLLSLELIFSFTSDPDVLQALEPSIRNVLVTFANELVTLEEAKDGSWVKKILKEIDNQAKAIEDIKNGVSAQQQQSQQGNQLQQQSSAGTFNTGPRARFNEEINGVRTLAHREERRLLSTILYFIASARLLSKPDILAVVRWTASTKEPVTDNTLPVSLTTLLAVLDTSTLEPEALLMRSGSASNRKQTSPALEALFADSKFITDLHSFVTTKVNWKASHSAEINPTQSTVQLAWSLFLIQAFRFKPTLVNETKIWENQVEDSIVNAVQSSALDYLANSLLRFKKPVDPFEEIGWNATTREDSAPPSADVDPDFQEHVIMRVDSLVESFITNASSILRKVRHREEDVLLATSLGRNTGTPTRRRASFREQAPSGVAAEQRHDIESLFSLIALLYRDAPDAALKYWLEDDGREVQYRHGRLSAFLRWAADCRVPSMVRSFFDMLGSLATGPQCATFAFEFLAQNGNGGDSSSTSLCSWSSLFDALTFYSSQRTAEGPTEIPPEEVTLLKSFLRLLRIVVSMSAVARATLYDNQRYKPVATLFNLIVQPIPVDLKAALLEGVAAFTKPATPDEGAGMLALSTEVAKRTWLTLESSQILPTIPQRDARGVIVKPSIAQGGIITELEQVEGPSRVYPATTAFINLLISLVGGTAGLGSVTSAATPVADTASQALRTIPDNLGAPHRSPAYGVEAYTRFVVEDVFLKAGSREYRNGGERWRVVERCLAYVERCLTNLKFDNFINSAGSYDATNPASSPAYQLLIDPGFDLLVRLLSGSPLLDEIFKLVSIDVETLESEGAPSTLVQAVLRALRVLERAFTLQSAYLEVVLPTLMESSNALPSEKTNALRSSQPLDQHLLYNSRVVVQIAVLVSNVRSKAIALAVVRILSFLADSSTFNVTDLFKDVYNVKMNRLAGLIDASDETLRVVDGFVRRLRNDPDFDDVADDLEESADVAEGGIEAAIQTAILDLLLLNTQPSRASPNIAHLLLGFDIKRRAQDLTIEDPLASADTRPSCLFVVLDYLERIQQDSTGQEPTSETPNLIVENPRLAEKCYRLVRQLCLHEYTSSATTSYLRFVQNYFFKQSLVLPLLLLPEEHTRSGHVALPNGRDIPTSAASVVASLHTQAWLLESLALEINTLISTGLNERAVQLLAALYGTHDSLAESEDDLLQSHRTRGLEQALPRMLDIFYNADFTWTDAVPVNETPISVYASVRFESCLRKDTSGCEIYDIPSVLTVLASARRALHSQGGLVNQQQQDAVRAETRAILENLVIENNRREIQFARFHSLEAWRSVLDITLTRAFSLLPSVGADALLLDLLSSVLPPISSDETDHAIKELFAGAAVLLMTELRHEGLRQQDTASTQSQIFSPDRLLPILQAIIKAIVQPGVSPVIRGNLYAVFLQYIQHSASSLTARGHQQQQASLPASQSFLALTDGQSEDQSLIDGVSTVGGTKHSLRRSPLQAGNLSTIQSAFDRLLAAICLDAASGSEVWQTVAFTMLDALLFAAGEGGTGSKLAVLLSKQGYLQAFVASIKDTEADLLDMLRPDPETLNALYVYEAKMSFLTRLAATKEGAERLLEARILPKLAQCTFLEARPRPNDIMEFDAFLPPVVQRYDQLVMPALQVALAVVTGCGTHNATAARQLVMFLQDQKEAMKDVMETATTAPTMVALREAQLLVQLMRSALSAVSDEDLASPTSFGGLHTSLLSLAAVVLSDQAWIATVQPTNEDEQAEADTLLPDVRKPGTVFDDALRDLVEALQMSILEYLKSTTKRPGSTVFRPVWLPTFQLDEAAGQRSVVSPLNLRGAFVFLLDSTDTLMARVEDQRELAFKLHNFEDIGIHELEMYEDYDEEEGQLDNQARRERVYGTLRDLQNKLKLRLLSSIHLVELALLLLWRHLGFYLDESSSKMSLNGRPKINGPLTSIGPKSLRGNLDLSNLRQNAQAAFAMVYERLDNVQFGRDAIGVDARSHEALVASLLRSILDLLGDKEAA